MGLFWFGVISVWGYFGLGLLWFGVILVGLFQWGYFGLGLFHTGAVINFIVFLSYVDVLV